MGLPRVPVERPGWQPAAPAGRRAGLSYPLWWPPFARPSTPQAMAAAAAAADEQADIYSQPTIAQLQELGLELSPRPPTSFQLWCRHLREQVGKRGQEGTRMVGGGGGGGPLAKCAASDTCRCPSIPPATLAYASHVPHRQLVNECHSRVAQHRRAAGAPLPIG